MARREPLYTAFDPRVFSSGLQPDLHPLLSLLWEAAANVQFASGRVKRRLPPALIHSVNANPIRGISQQQATNGTRWLWTVNGGTIARWYGPAPEVFVDDGWDQHETSTKPAGFYDFTHYGDWTIINGAANGSNGIFKPGAGIIGFGNAPNGVATFLKYLSFVMAFGYGARGTRVGWSDGDNIEEWTASASNLAGALTIDGFDTRIKAAKQLGSSIAVYAEDQMALVNYIGGTAVFGFKMALDGIGACGKFSVASTGKEHFGVGRGGIWWTDGLSYRYIDEGFLHDYLQDNVNWGQQSKITACRNDYTGCIDFAFPMGSALEPSEGWSYDPRTGGWTPIPPFTLKDERRLFGKPILGTSDGRVMRDQDNAGAAGPLTLRTKPLLMSQGGPAGLHISTKIDEVVLLLKNKNDVQFRLGSSQHVEGPYVWSDWIETITGAATYQIGSTPADGVYWKLDFRSTQADWSMDLQGFMLFGVVEGTKRDAA
jgi:hypothetical protein